MSRSSDPPRRLLWLERLSRHRRSDLTDAEFCQREGVSTPSFYYWKRKLGSEQDVPPEAQDDPAFLPVRVTAPIVHAPLEVTLPGGAVVRLPEGLPRHQLAELLAAVVDATTHDAAGEERQ